MIYLLLSYLTLNEPAWLVWLDRAEALRRSGDPQVEAAYAEALRAARAEPAESPAVAFVMHNTGFFLQRSGRSAEAERLYLAAHRWFAAHQPEYRSSLIRQVTNLAALYAESGRWYKVSDLLQPWAQVRDATYAGDLARLRGVYATALAEQRKFAVAEPMLVEVVSTLTQEAPSEIQQESLGLNLGNLASLYHATHRLPEALTAFQEALKVLDALAPRGALTLAATLCDAAGALEATQRVDDAIIYYQRALDIADARIDHGHPFIANLCLRYAKLLRKLHRREEAREEERRAQAILDRYDKENLPGATVDVRSFR
ncbi:MAG: tetratricopeptide repeat protein [Bryobacteraceae bacterium]|nr:tetratricopeptide repeat protein [Bryobacteraceae bacterium]